MGKFSFEEVNELYVDVLREIGNIGSGTVSYTHLRAHET